MSRKRKHDPPLEKSQMSPRGVSIHTFDLCNPLHHGYVENVVHQPQIIMYPDMVRQHREEPRYPLKRIQMMKPIPNRNIHRRSKSDTTLMAPSMRGEIGHDNLDIKYSEVDDFAIELDGLSSDEEGRSKTDDEIIQDDDDEYNDGLIGLEFLEERKEQASRNG